MSSPKSVKFISSITTKITIALLISFSIIATLVFYVVEKEGHDQVRKESERLIVEKGELVVNNISYDIASVMRSVTQLKDIGEILPLEKQAFDTGVDKIFDENNHTLLGSGGIWPDAYQLDATQETLPILRQRQAVGYQQVTPDEKVANYLNTPWFQAVKSLRPQSCVWNHAESTTIEKNLAISCGLAIIRDDEFWGVSSINFTLNSIQESIELLSEDIGEGYVVLADNSNQIVAAAGSNRLFTVDESTGQPRTLDDLLQDNPAWQPVYQEIDEQRQAVIDDMKPKLPKNLIDQFNNYDATMNTQQGSLIINYAAQQQGINPNLPINESTFLDSYTLTDEKIYGTDAEAYLFTIPSTLWKLVIVKPTSDVNAIADNLSKNLIKYLMFSLIATAAFIFLLLDFLALRPLQQTASSITQADKLINENKYNKLSSVQFINRGRDEIGLVNNSLHDLLMRIEDNEGKLANVNQQLEIKVEERTAELQKALKELKSSQVQLIRSEKMATLGQMVAGVAHEVNTPLSYVQNNLEIIAELTTMYEELIEKVSSLKSSMTNPDASEDDIEALMSDIMMAVEEIEEDELSEELKALIKDSLFGVEQITEMVLNLRNFARLDESKVKKISVEECIESSLKITRNAIKQLRIKTLFTDTPEVKCSPSQINQVLVNLINNAAQAIDNKHDGEIQISTLSDGTNVYVEVKDNGPGMTQEIQEQIFEPFFTTKGAGEGTGLGMAICQQIVEQHGGEITFESKVGTGTIFCVTLPIDGPIGA